MKPRRLLLRFLALWLLASALCASWVWINVVWTPTSTWMDAVFGAAAILGLMQWTTQLVILVPGRRVSRWASWGFLTLAALLMGILGYFSFVRDYVPRVIDAPGVPGAWLTIVLCLELGIVVLWVAITGRAAWDSLPPIFSRRLDALRSALSLTRIRSGRWLARLRRLLVAGLILAMVMIGSAMFVNARIPDISWRPLATAPNPLPNVETFMLDEQNGILYAGTQGGVFRSTNGGQTWEASSAGLTSHMVQTLALEERNSTLYAGTSDGVFRSTDGGTSWQRAGARLANRQVQALLFNEGNGALYAGLQDLGMATGGGVFRSTDGGESWAEVSTGLGATSVEALALDERTGILYVGGVKAVGATRGGGVFRSTDGGETWQDASAGLSDTNVATLVFDERDGTLYAGIGSRVFRSTNGGESWQQASSGLTGICVWIIALDDRDGTLYTGTCDGVFRSTDGGIHWEQAGTGLIVTHVYALLLDEGNGTLYAGTGGSGIFRSTDEGVTWQEASAGLIDISVRALMLNEQDGTLYAGTWTGGVFRSTDGGTSWEASSVGLGMVNARVQELALDTRNGMLYAGVGGGLFRSFDAGVSWERTGMYGTDVLALALDEQNGILYAGLHGAHGSVVFRSTDGGESWQDASGGLLYRSVEALVVDGRDGTLYAGTMRGLFRSADSGETWQLASMRLANTDVRALALNRRDGTLYAGTLGDGVFRSTDAGTSWEETNSGLTNMDVVALVLDSRDDTLYAGTGGGVFRSTDGGKSWRVGITGLTSTDVRALTLNQRDGTLYAGTLSGGVFRSTDGGNTWQCASTGLTDTSARALALDERDGALHVYVTLTGPGRGLFRSTDGGTSWQGIRVGLAAPHAQALALDDRDGALYAATSRGVSRSTDGGATWELGAQSCSKHALLNLLSVQDSYGVVTLGPEGVPVWATHGGGAFWAYVAGSLDLHQGAIRTLPQRRADILAAWGATIAHAELQPGYGRVPLVWLALRAWVWSTTSEPIAWGKANAHWLVLAVAVAVTLALVFTYTNLARPFGLPLWATVLAPRRLDAYASPAALEGAWPDWEETIRAELVRYGDVTTDDLRRIHGPFRRYALRRYADTYREIQSLEAHPGRIRLLSGERLGRWRAAWIATGKELETQLGLTSGGREAVDSLAAVLAEALGLTLGPPRDFEAVRAYLVEAPALRLQLPPRFPLVFVADPQPGERTVQMLVDAVDVLRETGYLALVVPLEPPVCKLDVAAQLSQTVERSPHVQDFIVLGGNDVLELIVARQPTQALVQRILTQVNLTVISPFVISGPVPERMFFGREAEVRTLVESAGTADFAIIGNRKIGKTSLLQRARARIEAGKRGRTLMVDCQTVRDAADFFAAFQSQTELKLRASTPDGLSKALTDMCSEGLPLVLLLDEVDALLAHEKAHGEPLAAAWRALAQDGLCRFVFCGSTGLARRLDDPQSVFFNFPQLLPLGYLSAEATRLVITQPLEMLGIVLEQSEELLAEVVALTSGHPNLVQYVGKGLVEAADHRGERRIALSDLTELSAATDFTEYYLKTVWGAAGPLERLITMVVPGDGFRLEELEAALAAHRVQAGDEELDTALKLLQIYSILEKHERTYTFVPQAFRGILHGTQEVERLIAQEKRRLTTGAVR